MLHAFLDFELDEDARELRCQGRPVATQTRVLDLIVHLLRARERVVSRDELMRALWQGQVVSDAAISQVIMLARKALGDEGESQRVIKTVRGRGIRFVAEVESRAARPSRITARDEAADAVAVAAASVSCSRAEPRASVIGRAPSWARSVMR
jgi:DNA-binding winged helix-turn-helix (wHTH) protein